MTAIKSGDRIRDNRDGRVLTAGYARYERRRFYWICLTDQGHARILEARIHTDGKPRKTGFTLLPRDGETK